MFVGKYFRFRVINQPLEYAVKFTRFKVPKHEKLHLHSFWLGQLGVKHKKLSRKNRVVRSLEQFCVHFLWPNVGERNSLHLLVFIFNKHEIDANGSIKFKLKLKIIHGCTANVH